MKRRVLWLLLAALLLLCACKAPAEDKREKDGRETPKVSQATSEVPANTNTKEKDQDKDEREDPMMDRLISETAVIRMRDQAENQFEKPLDLTLTDEETAAVCAALGELQKKDSPYGGYVMYVLDFLDRDGNLLDSVLVDNDVTLELSGGTAYRRSGSLDKALRAAEERCGVRSSLYTRRPGADYFSLFSQVDRGYLYEITENNFIKGLNLDLGREEIDALQSALTGADCSAQRLPQVPAKYIVELYSRGGGLVYSFTFDSEGHVYTLENYELLNTSLTDWLAALCG